MFLHGVVCTTQCEVLSASEVTTLWRYTNLFIIIIIIIIMVGVPEVGDKN